MSLHDLVLVSGATGFVGTEVALAFLHQGYRVRGTTRSPASAAEWNAKHRDYRDRMEWAIVSDVAAPGAFNEAMKGVTLFAHTASPFHRNVKDNLKDMLEPAIDGTREALTAARLTPSVRRVVVTSSFAAIMDLDAPNQGAGVTYTEKDWNPATMEQAIKHEDPSFVYCASKALAEKAAWKTAGEATNFTLTTLCPPMVFGPPHQVLKSLDSINESTNAIWSLIDAKEIPEAQFPSYIDVRDLARLHVHAVTEDVAKGQRYLCVAGHYSNSAVPAIVRRHFPQHAHRVAEAKPSLPPPHFKTDSSKAERDFKVKWIDFETSVKDMLEVLFALEEGQKEKEKKEAEASVERKGECE